MDREKVISFYNLSKKQIDLFEHFYEKLKHTNKKFNLVGSSTFENFWDRHINDSLQLSIFIKEKKSTIIDLGTGAGLPGIILSIYGYNNTLLIESKLKKIQFINNFILKTNISAKTICKRVEKVKNIKSDYIVCRAFAPLDRLLNYSLFFSKKGTTLLFLKGKNVNTEIEDAKKIFDFQYKLYKSKSKGDGFIIQITKFKKLWKK